MGSARETVWVVSGGASSEREVSLRSGAAVTAALQRAADTGAWFGVVHSVTITEDGEWLTPDGALSELDALKSLGDQHTCFLALHGGRGEDGRLQAVLESAGVRYTGSGPASSALCMDKRATRGVLIDEGVPVPPGRLVSALSAEGSDASNLLQELVDLSPHGAGWFVKPNTGGSSEGIALVRDPSELLPAVARVLDSGDRALVEARVAGVEVSVGVLGEQGSDLRALPTVEILPQGSEWFDVQEKYSESGAVEVCPPEHVAPDVDERLRMAALRAHVGAGCYGHSRVDFIVCDSGDFFALEVNTIPGMTERSLLPLEAAASGMTYEALCLELLRLARSRD